jgi:hypothetical protein
MPNSVLFFSKDHSSRLLISGVSQFPKKTFFNYGILAKKINLITWKQEKTIDDKRYFQKRIDGNRKPLELIDLTSLCRSA